MFYLCNCCIFQEDDDATQIGDDMDEWMQVHCSYKPQMFAFFVILRKSQKFDVVKN